MNRENKVAEALCHAFGYDWGTELRIAAKDEKSLSAEIVEECHYLAQVVIKALEAE